MAVLTKKDIVVRHEFNAARELVWNAWADPKNFARWWGPKNFAAPHVNIDFQKGGKYLYCMVGPGPDGVTRDYWSAGEYIDIVPMEKIVCTDSFADEDGKKVPASHYDLPGEWPLESTVTVTFEEQGGKTIMTLRHDGIPPEMSELCEAGWRESFDKLADTLAPRKKTGARQMA